MSEIKPDRIEKLWQEQKLTVYELKKEIEEKLKITKVYVDEKSRPGFKITISFFDGPEDQLDKYPAKTIARMFSDKLGMKISSCRQHHKSIKTPMRLTPRWKAEIETESFRELLEKTNNFLVSVPEIEKEYREMCGLFVKETLKPKNYRSPARIGGHLFRQKQKQNILDDFI